MSDETPELSSSRLTSLDVFRGITMASMVMVNNAGTWDAVYAPLRHAKWNGWTPTDLVFPAFLFIVGVAMTFSFDRRIAAGASRAGLFGHVCKRTAVLFLLGLILGGMVTFQEGGRVEFAFRLVGSFVLMAGGVALLGGKSITARNVSAMVIVLAAVACFVIDFETVRESKLAIPGVLQRIAVCYFFASLIVMFSGVRGRVIWTFALLAGYWAILTWVHPPADYQPAGLADRPEGRLHEWIDTRLLGDRLYRERPDPQGVLGTVTSLATVLIGVLAGNWLHGRREGRDKTIGLFVMANLLLVAGLWMDHVHPINKKIWTSSYVLVMGGLSLHLLAICYWLVDVRRSRWWTWPFLVFGTNAILIYVLAAVGTRILMVWEIQSAGGETISLKTWLYQTLASAMPSWTSPEFSSFLYAFLYMLFWFVVMIPFYRWRVFVKV